MSRCWEYKENVVLGLRLNPKWRPGQYGSPVVRSSATLVISIYAPLLVMVHTISSSGITGTSRGPAPDPLATTVVVPRLTQEMDEV